MSTVEAKTKLIALPPIGLTIKKLAPTRKRSVGSSEPERQREGGLSALIFRMYLTRKRMNERKEKTDKQATTAEQERVVNTKQKRNCPCVLFCLSLPFPSDAVGQRSKIRCEFIPRDIARSKMYIKVWRRSQHIGMGRYILCCMCIRSIYRFFKIR